ncbi:MAG: hypothetical protein Q7R53_01865, partial [bacterium]|nr:hypothetical protein [bacterium]
MAKKKSSSRSFLIVVLMIIVLALGFLYQKRTEGDINNLKIKVIPETVKKLVNNPSTPISIGDLKEANGLYEFELTLGKDASVQKYTSYISKDGKLFFTSGVKTADL